MTLRWVFGLLVLAAGTLAAQFSPAPPRRPDCVRVWRVDTRDLAPAAPPVISRGFSVGGKRSASGVSPLANPEWVDTTSLAGIHPSLRQPRRDSAALAEIQRQREAAAQIYPATIVVAAHLADASALAEVIRRTKPWHEDLLILPSARLTPATLEAALHALGNLRRASTEAPWVPESTFVHRPYTTDDTRQQQFDLIAIDGVRRAERTEIPGFGLVPACAIEVTAHPAPRRANH